MSENFHVAIVGVVDDVGEEDDDGDESDGEDCVITRVMVTVTAMKDVKMMPVMMGGDGNEDSLTVC